MYRQWFPTFWGTFYNIPEDSNKDNVTVKTSTYAPVSK